MSDEAMVEAFLGGQALPAYIEPRTGDEGLWAALLAYSPGLSAGETIRA